MGRAGQGTCHQTSAPLTGNQRWTRQGALMPDERVETNEESGQCRTALLTWNQVSSGGAGRGTSERGRACMRGVNITGGRAREVGGLFCTRLTPATGLALPQKLIIHVQKIHMLVVIHRQLQAALAWNNYRDEIPYQRFNLSAFARISQAAAALRAAICVCKTDGHRPACAVGNGCLD